jgi:hypothetical protein
LVGWSTAWIARRRCRRPVEPTLPVMPEACLVGHADPGSGVRRLQRVLGRHAASTSLCARIRLLPHDGLPERLQPPNTAAQNLETVLEDNSRPRARRRRLKR